MAAYAGENATVIYESDNVERIAELAKDADIIIVSVGEPSYQHDPPWGYDTLEITGSQQEILEAAKASGKPMVTVVTGGRPYILTWCDENTNAILEAYYPGSQGGIAIAETLFGLNNPTARRPCSSRGIWILSAIRKAMCPSTLKTRCMTTAGV